MMARRLLFLQDTMFRPTTIGIYYMVTDSEMSLIVHVHSTCLSHNTIIYMNTIIQYGNALQKEVFMSFLLL